MILLLELILILSAPIAHIILCRRRINGRINLSIIAITFFCMIAGIGLSILAAYIDINNLPPEIKCATGSAGLAVLGMFIAASVIPLSAIVFYLIGYYRKKKSLSHDTIVVN
jgi:hypothetical protein